MKNPQMNDLLLDQPQLMGVESLELDTVNLRMVARTLPGKQFEVGRQLRLMVIASLARAGIVSKAQSVLAGGQLRGPRMKLISRRTGDPRSAGPCICCAAGCARRHSS